jgi:hypothetical protein
VKGNLPKLRGNHPAEADSPLVLRPPASHRMAAKFAEDVLLSAHFGARTSTVRWIVARGNGLGN